MIEVAGLTKRYGDSGISDLAFSVRPGELFVFLGPNGAGKSTTVKILTGLLSPDTGTAVVAGHDVLTDRLGLKRDIGYMAERPFLYEKLTGREFLRFMAEVFLVPKRVWMDRAESLLGVFELLDDGDGLIETYSHGMRQKLALAAVLIHEPAVLFLDEPTNGLDPRAARVVKDVLTQICQRGATVFMTTHVLEVAQEMCDRVGVLHEGQLVACGSLDELRAQFSMPGATLEEIFLSITGAPATPSLALYQ